MLRLGRASMIGIMAAALGLLAIGCDGGGGGSGSCRSTCERAIGLSCPSETRTVDQCTTECEEQIRGCADSAVVQRYLDCVQSSRMECGDTTGTASSPECVSEGLAYFVCLSSGGGDGGT